MNDSDVMENKRFFVNVFEDVDYCIIYVNDTALEVSRTAKCHNSEIEATIEELKQDIREVEDRVIASIDWEFFAKWKQ